LPKEIVMGFLREYIEKANGFLEKYISSAINKIAEFISSGEYLVIAVIGFFITLLLIIGLFRWLRKAPKTFMFVLIVCVLVIAIGLISK
jgi:glucan phosphoethanolaminetransferase (alkaline phosphatase superfamily)